MEVIIKFLLVIFSAISFTFCCAQEDQLLNINSRDSVTVITEQHKVRFNLNSKPENNLFYLDRMNYNNYLKFTYDRSMPYSSVPLHQEEETGNINMLKQKGKLLQALQMKNKFEMDTDLGVFGQILGYANAAAAVTLMFVHMNKYYWNEDKKKTKK